MHNGIYILARHRLYCEKSPGGLLNWRCCPTSVGIPIIKIRLIRSHSQLIFLMGIPIPRKAALGSSAINRRLPRYHGSWGLHLGPTGPRWAHVSPMLAPWTLLSGLSLVLDIPLWRYDDRNINSSPPSAAYMQRWTRSALVQVMACRLSSVKSFPESMLPYCQLDPL